MAKADRVLALLEALQDRASATGPELARRLGVDVRTIRRDIVALRDLGIPVEGERGRGGSYRLRPGYRVPPLMFTAGEAAAVALGLMAARRLGIDADARAGEGPPGAPGPHAARRRGARAHARLHRRARHRAARPRERCWRSPRRSAASAASRPATPTPPGVESARLLTPVRPRRPQRPLVRPRVRPPARGAARAARRPLRPDRARRPAHRARRRGFDAVAFVSRALARVPWTHEVEVVLHTTPAIAERRFPPTLAELEPHADGTLLRLRADSLDWAAGLLAAAGCDFTVRHPDALRAALRRLATPPNGSLKGQSL